MNEIPENFLDLVNCPRVAALTTVMPDGRPQTTVVWCDFDGEFVRVNTMRSFRKEKNMRANPKVSLLVVDPEDTSRYVEIRGPILDLLSPIRTKRSTFRVLLFSVFAILIIHLITPS